MRCDAAVSGLYALAESDSRVSTRSKAPKGLGEVGEMDMDFKISASGFGEVGGEEREMDLWDAVSLSSKKLSSSSAKGFGFSVTEFFEGEKCSSDMISQRSL